MTITCLICGLPETHAYRSECIQALKGRLLLAERDVESWKMLANSSRERAEAAEARALGAERSLHKTMTDLENDHDTSEG